MSVKTVWECNWLTTKTENLWKTYETINELIKFADTKATAILAVSGVIAGFYFSNVSSIQTVLERSPIAIIPLTTAMGFILISAVFAMHCMIPRLGTKKNCLNRQMAFTLSSLPLFYV